jgi:hypothetical protein
MRAISLLIGVAIAAASVSAGAQQPETAATMPLNVKPSVESARQSQMNTVLHEKTVAAGGQLRETRDAKLADLSQDLPALINRSDEIVLAHVLTSYGGVAASGDRAQSHYDVQILQSWKGSHASGDVITLFVPAGGLRFADGTLAQRNVRELEPLRNGGRYVLFLRSTTTDGQSAPSLWLTGDGVQGAFLLAEEKVQPVYKKGPLFQTYNRQGVSAFIAELNANLGRP